MFKHVTVSPNPQFVLDAVVPILMNQGPSISSSGVPRYRTSKDDQPFDNKPRCACPIGLLISEKHYQPELEGESVYNMDVQRAIIASQDWTDVQFEYMLPFLAALQMAHDRYKDHVANSERKGEAPMEFRTWFEPELESLRVRMRYRYGELADPLAA